MKDTRILVFSKAPVPGKAKTRLIPALGEEGAARLQQHLIYRTLTSTTDVKNTETVLYCSPDTKHTVFQRCREQFGVQLMQQQGTDLGERMFHAASTALLDAQQIMLVGTDCPTLDVDYLMQATALLQNGADAVLGPALDGGYVLLGLRKVDPALFSNIKWGAPEVLEQTRSRMSRLDWRWQELPPLSDLDRPEDLSTYPELMHFRGETGMGVNDGLVG